MRLGEIAHIQTGIFAKPFPGGEIVYLQSKHFNENGDMLALIHPELKAADINEKHLLKQGDVLFAAKGTKNFATWYENNNLPAVASTSFFVIRVHENLTKIILPGFLAWSINHPSAQKFLKGNAIGTSIVSISKSVLEALEIPVPNVKTQKAVLKFNHLYNTEKRLKQEIQTLREKQIQQQIINAIK